ncbi:MAG: hypothetical protein R3Y61_08175 [Rikenellaceae bacterium]
MSRKKIIILDNENLTIRRRELFCIEELQRAGFEVEFWDLSLLSIDMEICDQLSEPYLRKFSTLGEFQCAVKEQNMQETLFIVEVWYKWSSRRILKTLKKNKCFTIKINLYAKILYSSKNLSLSFSWNTVKYILSKAGDELSYVAFKVYCAMSKMNRKFDYCISSDSRRKSTQTLINHPDWVRSQVIENSPRSEDIPSEPYVVFIDQFYPLHPDFKRDFPGKLGDAELYRAELNRFFDIIKRDLGYDTVIAAHPKATYTSDSFGGRKIFKYRTEELVRYSEGALLHTSLAVSYILIFDKPVMLITNSEHKKTTKLMVVQQRYEEFLGLGTVDTDTVTELSGADLKNVETEIREKYIYSILTSRGIEGRLNSDILIETLGSLVISD